MTRNRHTIETCYMCDKPETSREHFPPKCFFPEGYKKDLLTVPSCNEHNSGKSKDDEYLFLMLYSHYENTPQEQMELRKKAKSIVQHNPNLRKLFVNARPVGDKHIAFNVDRDRINKEIEQIARAAYYYDYHDKWLYKISVLCTGLLSDPSTDGFKALSGNIMLKDLSNITGEFFQNYVRKGSDQKIFYYQIDKNLDQKIFFMRMVFLNGWVAIAYSSPDTTNNS